MCLEPAGATLVASVSGVGVAMALIGEVQPVAVSMGEQAEEGASKVPVVGAARPIVSSAS